jgi:hypothetical protein
MHLEPGPRPARQAAGLAARALLVRRAARFDSQPPQRIMANCGAPLAQRIERWPPEPEAAGLNPARGTTRPLLSSTPPPPVTGILAYTTGQSKPLPVSVRSSERWPSRTLLPSRTGVWRSLWHLARSRRQRAWALGSRARFGAFLCSHALVYRLARHPHHSCCMYGRADTDSPRACAVLLDCLRFGRCSRSTISCASPHPGKAQSLPGAGPRAFRR